MTRDCRAFDFAIPYKTHSALQKNPKQVLRNIAETVTNLKEMFQNTSGSKYCDAMHAEVSKLIPKTSKIYKTVEAVVVAKDDDIGDDKLVAISSKIDATNEEYYEVRSAYNKFFPKAKKQRTA